VALAKPVSGRLIQPHGCGWGLGGNGCITLAGGAEVAGAAHAKLSSILSRIRSAGNA